MKSWYTRASTVAAAWRKAGAYSVKNTIDPLVNVCDTKYAPYTPQACIWSCIWTQCAGSNVAFDAFPGLRGMYFHISSAQQQNFGQDMQALVKCADLGHVGANIRQNEVQEDRTMPLPLRHERHLRLGLNHDNHISVRVDNHTVW